MAQAHNFTKTELQINKMATLFTIYISSVILCCDHKLYPKHTRL